jgi:RNA polymerase sigma-70 factor (ECF subfamily)
VVFPYPCSQQRVSLIPWHLRGEMDAFQLLIKEHERLVSHMVGRLIKNKQDHEEICQDVFLKVYDKLNAFTFQSKLSTWIATIAYRLAINFVRKKKLMVTEESEESLNERFRNYETPEEVLMEKDLDTHIRILIDKLPAQYKMVLTLFHLDDMNYEEITEITGMPAGTVKNYLFRARNILKEKILKLHANEEIL